MHRTLAASLLLLLHVFGGGCATVAAEAPPGSLRAAALDGVPRTVFVMAARQKPRIVESLAAAGVEVSANLLDAGFVLRVTIGADQGFSSCGTRNNVKYSLRREGLIELELVEKGWTGTCEPNVFDALSARLARALAGGGGPLRAPGES